MVKRINKDTPIQYGIGIDQGLANIGIAILSNAPSFKSNPHPLSNKFTVIESGVLTTSSDMTLGDRLKIIFDYLKERIEKYNCSFISCEKLFHNEKQKNGRNKSASIVRTNMVSGLIYLLGGLFDIPVFEFVPGTVKKHITGNGQATKEQMIETIENWLKLNFHKNEEHRADAIGICIAGFEKYPKHQEEMLDIDVQFVTELWNKEDIKLEKRINKYHKEYDKILKRNNRLKELESKRIQKELLKKEKELKRLEKEQIQKNVIINKENKIYNKKECNNSRNDNHLNESTIIHYRFE